MPAQSPPRNVKDATKQLVADLKARAKWLQLGALVYHIQIWIVLLGGIYAITYAQFLVRLDRESFQSEATRHMIKELKDQNEIIDSQVESLKTKLEEQRENIKESLNNAGEAWITIESNYFLNNVAISHDGGIGVAVGDNGRIYSTTYDRRGWRRMPRSGTTADLIDVAVHKDGNSAVAVGDNGVLLTSADAGDSWSVATSGVTEMLIGVALGDNDNGIAVGRGGIVVTTRDRGKSWVSRNSGTDSNLLDIALTANGLHGIAVGRRGTVVVTNDGGDSWRSADSGTTGRFTHVAIAATDGRVGIAVGPDSPIIYTKDGGENWR